MSCFRVAFLYGYVCICTRFWGEIVTKIIEMKRSSSNVVLMTENKDCTCEIVDLKNWMKNEVSKLTTNWLQVDYMLTTSDVTSLDTARNWFSTSFILVLESSWEVSQRYFTFSLFILFYTNHHYVCAGTLDNKTFKSVF